MFTWDANKAGSNSKKRGASFGEASTVFDDPSGLEREDRFKRLALSAEQRILIVVYAVWRNEHGEEIIRVISARQADRAERKVYARQQDRLQ